MTEARARRANQRFTCPALFEKIFSFSFDPNHLYISRIPAHTEGRFAIVTNVGQGMRWTRKHAAQIFARTNGADADGEVVWS
jgi:hypothetical protein